MKNEKRREAEKRRHGVSWIERRSSKTQDDGYKKGRSREDGTQESGKGRRGEDGNCGILSEGLLRRNDGINGMMEQSPEGTTYL